MKKRVENAILFIMMMVVVVVLILLVAHSEVIGADEPEDSWTLEELREMTEEPILIEPVDDPVTVVIDPDRGETVIWKMDEIGATLIKKGDKQVACFEIEEGFVRCQ